LSVLEIDQRGRCPNDKYDQRKKRKTGFMPEEPGFHITTP
jgi:hypothetical protein